MGYMFSKLTEREHRTRNTETTNVISTALIALMDVCFTLLLYKFLVLEESIFTRYWWLIVLVEGYLILSETFVFIRVYVIDSTIDQIDLYLYFLVVRSISLD